MEFITRNQVNRMSELLESVDTDEGRKLSNTLKKADIIPKLYQYAYVESLHKLLAKFKSVDKLVENLKYSYSHEKYLIEKENPLNAVKGILAKAHERQNEICDFEDSTLDQHSMGKCQDENHLEGIDQDILTEEESKTFDKINEEKGYIEACDHFIDKFNPEDQALTLILNFNDDETKCIKDDGYYVCDSCLEAIQDNGDGNISCDLEMADDN